MDDFSLTKLIVASATQPLVLAAATARTECEEWQPLLLILWYIL
jgi:hypothetical protein